MHTYDEKEFEFNMLLENRDDLERAEYWYYEVKCDNVSELSIPSDDDFWGFISNKIISGEERKKFGT